jgi:nucleoside-diphosphate-sugar epimerase
MGIERIIADALEKYTFKVKVPFFLLDFLSVVTEAAAKITRQTPTLNRQKVQDLKQRFWICNSTKAQEELGYRPTYSLQKGIQQTADWYRANGWL